MGPSQNTRPSEAGQEQMRACCVSSKVYSFSAHFWVKFHVIQRARKSSGLGAFLMTHDSRVKWDVYL